MKSVLAVALRELRRIANLKAAFSVLVMSCIIYSVYYPQPYLAEVLRDIPVAIVDNDNTTTSRDFIRRVDASADAKVAFETPDYAAAQMQVFARKVSGILVIPQHFERDLLRGRPSPVAFYGDASYFLLYQKLNGAIAAVAGAMGAEMVVGRLVGQGATPASAQAAAQPLVLTSIPLFNPASGYATNTIPASFLLIIQQTILIAVGLLNNTRFNDGPANIAPPMETMIGKLVAYTVLELVMYTYLIIVAQHLFYDIPRIGSLANSYVFATLFIMAVASLGLLFSKIIRNPLMFQLVMTCMGMPLFFLAGMSWPAEMIPPFLYAIGHAIPSTVGIETGVRINQMGATLSDVHMPLMMLLGLIIGYTTLAIWLERRDRASVAPSNGPAIGKATVANAS